MLPALQIMNWPFHIGIHDKFPMNHMTCKILQYWIRCQIFVFIRFQV